MLYRYKEVFSLGDGIGTCLNIEVEIDMVYRTQFSMRPYIKKEDKQIENKEMKRLSHSCILKEGFSA